VLPSRPLEDWVTTIFSRPGHHALFPNNTVAFPAADPTVARISHLLTCDLPALLGTITARRRRQEQC
jgi:hypothetical protein